MRDPFSDPRPLVRRVYSYVAYRIGDGPDAEDITNEAFERGLRYRDSFDSRRGDPAAWLIGIARRCIADAAFKRDIPSDALPEESDSGHEDQSLRRLELGGALEQLDERDRELIALRYGSDLTARQIAELLEMNTNAVEVALHRALKTLRVALETGGPEDGPARVDVKWPAQQPT